MTDPKPEKRGRAGFWAAVVFGLLVLYVASSGPVHYAWHRVGDTGKLRYYRALYAPVYWAADRLSLAQRFDEWRKWWTPITMP